jgi:hypothetical protein
MGSTRISNSLLGLTDEKWRLWAPFFVAASQA